MSTKIATFAAGCYWCLEYALDHTEGVLQAISGFAGGTEPQNPSYMQVASGQTDWYEAVQIHFESDQVSYQDLLKIFWQQIDPTDPGGQFSIEDLSIEPQFFITTRLKSSKQKTQNKNLQTQNGLINQSLPR